MALNEIGYMLRPSTTKRLFWSLPPYFTGDKVASYGGKLEFVQRYTERPGARHSMDIDVMLSGNGVTVYWTNPEKLIPDRPNVSLYHIIISENQFTKKLYEKYKLHSDWDSVIFPF